MIHKGYELGTIQTLITLTYWLFMRLVFEIVLYILFFVYPWRRGSPSWLRHLFRRLFGFSSVETKHVVEKDLDVHFVLNPQDYRSFSLQLLTSIGKRLWFIRRKILSVYTFILVVSCIFIISNPTLYPIFLVFLTTFTSVFPFFPSNLVFGSYIYPKIHIKI